MASMDGCNQGAEHGNIPIRTEHNKGRPDVGGQFGGLDMGGQFGGADLHSLAQI